MSKQERLFRPQFRPVAQMGEIVALRLGNGFVMEENDTPFYQVTNVESQLAIGVKGTVVIWCATNAPGAPYNADKSSAIGQNLGVNIAAGSQLSFQPDFFQIQKLQFGQFRFLLRSVPDSGGNFITGALDDFDVRMAVPAAVLRGGTQRIIGVLNAAFQAHLPSDSTAAPAQGANLTPSTNLDNDPFDKAARTELFTYGSDSGRGELTIINRGSAATSQGALGLNVGLFLFNLTPVPMEGVRDGWLLGHKVAIPQAVHDLPHGLHDVILVPAAGEPSPKGSGS